MRRSAVLLLTAGLLMAACSSRTAPASAAPPFELKSLSGEKVSLENFQGKPVVLDFWATWCGPCRMSIPMLQRFYERHKSEGLVVLGVNMDDEPGGVYPFVKEMGMTYPVLFGGNSDIGSQYGVEGIPTFVFIDRQGRVADRFEGFSMEMPGAWESVLQRIEAQPSK